MAKFVNNIRKISAIELGQNSFYLGTLLLSTTNLISGLFFLISLIISLKVKPISFKKDKWNLTLLFTSVLMVLSTFKVSIFQNYSVLYQVATDNHWNQLSIWTGLFNWIPLFIAFSGFQIYLKKESQRIRFAKFLFMGLIPVLFTFLLQKWFNVVGPFKSLFGMIIFYMRSPESYGYTGLFNNPNYAGIWLAVSLPFSILIFQLNEYKKFRQLFILTIIFSTISCIIYTNSRNSFIGILIGTSIMTSAKFLMICIAIIFLIYLLINNLTFFPLLDALLIDEIIPEKIIKKIFQTNYLDIYKSPRINIWSETISLITQKPIFGWGAATFIFLYLSKGGFKAVHTHNMPLELAQIYGVPVALILTLFVTFLFFKSIKVIFKPNNNSSSKINKAWISAALIILVSHMSDITYYDGRISILIWILLSGLKCIIENNVPLKIIKSE